MSNLSRLLFILLLAIPCVAQAPWSSIIPSGRAIRWDQDGGLPATLTYGTGGSACNGSLTNCVETAANQMTPPVRTQCGTTLTSPSVATVQADLIACKAGTYLLFTGTFTAASTNLNLFAANGGCTSPGNCPAAGLNGGGVTLRGTGADSATIKLTGSSVIGFGVSWSAPSCTVTGGFSAGSSALTVSGCTTAPVVGQMIFLKQCDDGWSGSGCSTGASVDPGGPYICGWDPVCQNPANPPTTPHSEQQQTLYVTSVSGSGTLTLGISPSIYMPNWSTDRTPVISWTGEVPGSNAPAILGLGLEDMTVDETGTSWGGISANEGVAFANCYACWIKGVRVLGQGTTGSGISISNSLRGLIMSNHILDNPFDSGDNLIVISNGNSDVLILNNFLEYGDCMEEDSGQEGEIWAFNYCRDANTNGYFAVFFRHVAGQSFGLQEGNEIGNTDEDSIHGYGKDLNTWFRNFLTGSDPPFTGAAGPFAIQIDQGARFENVIGNIIGTSGQITSYSGTGSNVAFRLSGGCCGDALANLSLLRWDNCDTATGTCRTNSDENPSTLSGYTGTTLMLTGSGTSWTGTIPGGNLPILFGSEVLVDQTTGQSPNTMGYDTAGTGTITGANIASATVNNSTGVVTVTFSATPPVTPNLHYIFSTGSASPFQGLASPSSSLPCSFFISSYTSTSCSAHQSGGTGLPFWKTCTNWSSFPASCGTYTTQPFPLSGPDVSGGPHVAGTGTAYDPPPYEAWIGLPIDTNYQSSFTITNSSWSSGVETLTVSGLPASVHHLMGGMRLSGVNSACMPSSGVSYTGRSDGELLITNSSTTTVAYATANPGVSCTGTMLWPDVRQFNESVFQNDPVAASFSPSSGFLGSTSGIIH